MTIQVCFYSVWGLFFFIMLMQLMNALFFFPFFSPQLNWRSLFFLQISQNNSAAKDLACTTMAIIGRGGGGIYHLYFFLNVFMPKKYFYHFIFITSKKFFIKPFIGCDYPKVFFLYPSHSVHVNCKINF